MLNYSLRPLDLTDIPRIAAWVPTVPLWQRYQLSESATVRQLEQAVHDCDLLLVIDRKPEPLACAFAWCLPKGMLGLSAYLRLIGVQPGLEGQGLGARLLEAVEREAKQSSDDLFLLVSDFNHAAQRFYRRQGYQQIGTISSYVLPDVSERIFRKRLGTR